MTNKLTSVNFLCQLCNKPLRPDNSLDSILENSENSVLDLLRDPDSQETQPLTENFDQSVKINEKSNEAIHNLRHFAELNHIPKLDKIGNLDRTIKILSKFFDTLTERSELDHPLCANCAESMLKVLEDKINYLNKNMADQSKFIEQLKSVDLPNYSTSEIELSNLLAEMEFSLNNQSSMKHALSKILNEIKKEEQLIDSLNNEETTLNFQINFHKFSLDKLKMEAMALNNQINHYNNINQSLSATNVFELAFDISEEDGIACINGCHLGKSAKFPMDWSEINAGLGFLCLLLHAMALSVGHKFERYEVIPMGSQSYIENLSTNKVLPLFDTGGVKMFWDTKLNDALVGFLDCVNQIRNVIHKNQNVFKFPFDIDNDYIFENSEHTSAVSIKNPSSNPEKWTICMKLLCINLKIGLAWLKAMDDHS